MRKSDSSDADMSAALRRRRRAREATPTMNAMANQTQFGPAAPQARTEDAEMLAFVLDMVDEVEAAIDLVTSDAHLRMALELLQAHFTARIVTPTSLIGASRLPYATATRRVKEMVEAGLIDQRPRTRTGKTFSMHPSDKLLAQWTQLSGRLRRLAERRFAGEPQERTTQDYYFGGSYAESQSIPPLPVLPTPLKAPGGLRVLVHGDPTFMVMVNLKRQFEQVIGAQIHQRAFSIDWLREEALRNARRPTSRYDIIAVDLPWIGEFVEKGVLTPLDAALDIDRLDPADFHTAGWKAAHWGGRAYGVPAQTTPELLFYRRDLFASAGLKPPTTTQELRHAAAARHDPQRGATASRGTPPAALRSATPC